MYWVGSFLVAMPVASIVYELDAKNDTYPTSERMIQSIVTVVSSIGPNEGKEEVCCVLVAGAVLDPETVVMV